MEVTVHRRLSKEPRVELVLLEERAQRSTHYVSRRIRRQAEGRCRIRPDVGNRIVKDVRRRSRDVQQNVLERGVISDGITGADDRGIVLTEKRFLESTLA